MNSFRTAIFIDGGYLDNVLRNNNKARIDYSLFCKNLLNNEHLLRTYYYHCLPYQPQNPTEEEKQNFSSAEKFLKKLSSLNSFTVRKGKLAYRGKDEKGNPIFEQKRVDTYLATDLVMHSTKRLISHAIIITGDSDFIPAVEIAQAEGVSVTLCYSNCSQPHDELLDAVDSRIEINQELINKSKRV